MTGSLFFIDSRLCTWRDKVNIEKFWEAVLKQDADAIRMYFRPDAYVNWHNTNEHFTLEEYIRANCEYPGEWDGGVERIVLSGDEIVTATHVCSKDGSVSVHATSFIRIERDRIVSIDEYWGDDGEVPQWRKEMHIGGKIKEQKPASEQFETRI